MSRRCARRVENMKPSDIRRFSAIVQEMGGVNLSQGVCDQPAPDVVKQAAKDAIDANRSIYTHLRGTRELREAIARKMRDFNGIPADPETEIVVTCGSAGAFACAILALLEPGDEVIVFSPFYSYYVDTLRLVEAEVRFVRTRAPDWSYDPSELAAAFTTRTRMVIVNTPCNPTGKVFTEAELTAIAELAARHDAWILTDEVYEYITFGKPHVSLGRLLPAVGRTITLSGASKTYAVTGWRVGYAVGPADVMEKVGVVSDWLNICAPAPLQAGVLAGLKLPDGYYRELADDYRRRRDLLVQTLREIGFTPFTPDGAIYVMAEFPAGRYPNARQAAEGILHGVGVATVPATQFYGDPTEGERSLRFCFAKPWAQLEEGCRRLRRLGRESS